MASKNACQKNKMFGSSSTVCYSPVAAFYFDAGSATGLFQLSPGGPCQASTDIRAQNWKGDARDGAELVRSLLAGIALAVIMARLHNVAEIPQRTADMSLST
jgi:hypothetical protein